MFLPCLFGSLIKVPTELYELWEKFDHHPGNAPLISDLTFRAIADHVIDQGTEWFDPEIVETGDIIYLNLWYISWFHDQIHDQIKHPYILLTCDVGNWFPDLAHQELLYDSKLAAWFCRNICFSNHPKLFQIPMGQTDRYFGYGSLGSLQSLTRQMPFEKKDLLYMNFFPRDFGDRDKIVKLFENAPYCFSRNRSDMEYGYIEKEEYYKELASSSFVISPWGLESDCVRTWEALALGAIPIVEHSFLDPLFDGLPVLFVHDWSEINESFLRERYEDLKDRTLDRAYFDYWHNKIKECQDKIRNGDLSGSQLKATSFTSEEMRDLFLILTEEGHENPFLICKGFLTTIHSLQIAERAHFLDKIFLCDPWLYPETYFSFEKYMDDSPLLENRRKVTLISEQEFNTQFLNYNPFAFEEAPIFLDLSYQRSTLLTEFLDAKAPVSNFRHNLKNDLLALYEKIRSGGLILGNKADDPYVGEVLDRLVKEGIKIQRRGSFWFFRK